jgi:hypothetical protein
MEITYLKMRMAICLQIPSAFSKGGRTLGYRMYVRSVILGKYI